MLCKNVSNEFLYAKYIENIEFETPYENISGILNDSAVEIEHCIDDIYVVNGSTVMSGNSISASYVAGIALQQIHIDHELKHTGKYSFYKDLKIPYILRKKFHRNSTEKARLFYKALLNLGTVTMTPTNALALNAISRLSTLEECDLAWDKLVKTHANITIESSQEGDAFKVFVHDGEVIGIYGIVPAFVVGDGVSTVQTLVRNLKTQRSKNILYKNIPLNRFRKDLDLSVIPAAGELVQLKTSRQIEYGAVYVDLTLPLKDVFKDLAIHLKKIILDIKYLEITCFSEDIAKGLDANSFVIGEFKQSKADIRHLFSCVTQVNAAHTLVQKLFPIGTIAEEIRFEKPEIYDNKHFKYTSQVYTLTEAAYQLGLRVDKIGGKFTKIENSLTNKSLLFYAGISQNTTAAARILTSNKYLTKRILEKCNVNTPKGFQFNIQEQGKAWEEVKNYCQSLNKRLVVKPLDSQGGTGVSTDITNQSEFQKAWDICKKLGSKNIIVEEQLSGDDYRVVVVQNSVCGVSQRVAAYVVGDGVHTIKELIHNRNELRKSNIFLKDSSVLITESLLNFLAKRNIFLDDIPAVDEKIILSEVANASVGGDIIDRTNDLHPDWIPIAVKIRKALANAYHVGLDIMMEDIAKSPSEQQWAVIEVNTNPDFGVQLFPGQGSSRNIAPIFLEKLFSPVKSNDVAYQLTIFGKVQGVGFRKWFKSICDYRSVVGYVRNKTEINQVEAFIVGPKLILNDIVVLSHQGPKVANVTSVLWNESELIDHQNTVNELVIR